MPSLGAGPRSRTESYGPLEQRPRCRNPADRPNDSTRSSVTAPSPGPAGRDTRVRPATTAGFASGSHRPSPGPAGSSHPPEAQESAFDDYTSDNDLLKSGGLAGPAGTPLAQVATFPRERDSAGLGIPRPERYRIPCLSDADPSRRRVLDEPRPPTRALPRAAAPLQQVRKPISVRLAPRTRQPSIGSRWGILSELAAEILPITFACRPSTTR